jgi:hypothetical protein
MTLEKQTGAYQKIRPDHHAPVSGGLSPTGGRMGGTDRGEQLTHSTQPTKTADSHATPTRHHTNQTLIALTPTEAAQVLAIAMRNPERDDLPILEHLAFLLDRATLPTQPRTATNPTNAQHTDTD